MPNIQERIAGLWGGISQQLPSLRLPEQVESLVNYRNTLIKGLSKRPSTRFVKEYTAGVDMPFSLGYNQAPQTDTHIIERDSSERYMVLFADDANEPIVVIDTADGTKKTVNWSDATTDKPYCQATAQGLIKAATVDDTTVLVNSGTTTAMSTANVVSPSGKQNALIWAKPGFGSDLHLSLLFQFTATGDKYRASAHINHPNTDDVIDGIVSLIGSTGWEKEDAAGNITFSQALPNIDMAYVDGSVDGIDPSGSVSAPNTSVLHVSSTNNTDFTLTSSDDYGNSAVSVIQGAVDRVSDLPPTAPNGYVLQVRGEKADIWFKYLQDTGSWVESIGAEPGETTAYQFDAASMPRIMVRQANGTFLVYRPEWAERVVGDIYTVPEPSFIGKTISNVNWYKDRLVFLSNQAVIFSKIADYYNFWPTTVADVLDDDPIDIVASHSSVSLLTDSLSFEDGLLLFSSQQQFTVHSGDSAFSASTVQLDLTTSANFAGKCKPMKVGSMAYFVGESEQSSVVWEYFVNPSSVVREVANITAHTPSLLPKDVTLAASSSQHDMLFFLSPSNPQFVYVYQYYWRGDEKQMSAWTKWTFPGPIQSLGVLGEELFVMTWKFSTYAVGEKLQLAKMNIDPTENIFANANLLNVHGDLCIESNDSSVSVSYDPVTDKTTVTLPYSPPAALTYAPSSTYSGGLPKKLTYSISESRTNNTVVFDGEITASSNAMFLVGLHYDIALSRWYPRDNRGAGITDASLMVRGLTVSTSNSGEYYLYISYKRDDSSGSDYYSPSLPDSRFQIPINNVTQRHSIRGNPNYLEVAIYSENPYPLTIDSISWDGLIRNLRRYR